ncbi:MAG: hypothetical protein M3N07_08885 [Pseudomonadota bacterium]|nr:hypothetical protein [Pseudomonadota bacterium]
MKELAEELLSSALAAAAAPDRIGGTSTIRIGTAASAAAIASGVGPCARVIVGEAAAATPAAIACRIGTRAGIIIGETAAAGMTLKLPSVLEDHRLRVVEARAAPGADGGHHLLLGDAFLSQRVLQQPAHSVSCGAMYAQLR